MGIERKPRTARLDPETDQWCVRMAGEVFHVTVSDFINLRLTWDMLMHQAGLIAPSVEAVHVYVVHNRVRRAQPGPMKYEPHKAFVKGMTA